jgi:hypothetical protein
LSKCATCRSRSAASRPSTRHHRPLPRRSGRRARPQRRRQVGADEDAVGRAAARRCGEIYINGEKATINNPRDARNYKIETIYQYLALADNLDAASNLFLGRELVTPMGFVDDAKMEAETRKIMGGSTRTSGASIRRSRAVGRPAAIGGDRRAVYFNAKILIMDEPTAALACRNADGRRTDRRAEVGGHRHLS